MSGRVASLDLLRGMAAFAVAIPHFLMFHNIDAEGAETMSILGVEVFFVLSGYVLAPQLLALAERPSWHNLGVFWVRRWMRPLMRLSIARAAATRSFSSSWRGAPHGRRGRPGRSRRSARSRPSPRASGL